MQFFLWIVIVQRVAEFEFQFLTLIEMSATPAVCVSVDFIILIMRFNYVKRWQGKLATVYQLGRRNVVAVNVTETLLLRVVAKRRLSETKKKK
jgi:hypothetical protein